MRRPQHGADNSVHMAPRLRLLPCLPIAAALLVCAPAAHAAVLTINGNSGVLAYSGSEGEANHVSIAFDSSATKVAITDPGAKAWAVGLSGSGSRNCVKSGSTVTCTANGIRSLAIALGEGDDTLTTNTDLPVSADGGPGADNLATGRGADKLQGGNGRDVLAGGPGADYIAGGSSEDAVDYTAATDAVSVTHDGLANDGAAKEGDNVAADVESAAGGDGADILHAGADGGRLSGGPGDDALYGDAGPDVLAGGGGIDSFFAAGGDDKILAQDNAAEKIDCGDGADQVTADPVDALAPNCDVPTPTPPEGGSGGGEDDPDPSPGPAPVDPPVTQPAPDITMPVRPVSVAAPGVVKVRFGCDADPDAVCRGDIYIEAPAHYFVSTKGHGKVHTAARGHYTAQQRRLGHRRFKVAGGKKLAAHVHVALRGHYVLRNRHKVRGRLRVVQRNAAGKVLGTTTRPITLGRKWSRGKVLRNRLHH
jgi:hypothetical protein